VATVLRQRLPPTVRKFSRHKFADVWLVRESVTASAGYFAARGRSAYTLVKLETGRTHPPHGTPFGGDPTTVNLTPMRGWVLVEQHRLVDSSGSLIPMSVHVHRRDLASLLSLPFGPESPPSELIEWCLRQDDERTANLVRELTGCPPILRNGEQGSRSCLAISRTRPTYLLGY
jgi:hypothetical protein